MELEEIKKLAKELKTNIETELEKFREATGYVPQVEIITKSRQTNDGAFTNQSVQVTLTIQ